MTETLRDKAKRWLESGQRKTEKPSIADLEAILDEGNPGKATIEPDGSVVVRSDADNEARLRSLTELLQSVRAQGRREGAEEMREKCNRLARNAPFYETDVADTIRNLPTTPDESRRAIRCRSLGARSSSSPTSRSLPMTTDMPQRPTSTNADEWCLYLTEVTPAAPEYIAVQIVEALEAAQAQGRREGAEEMRERGVEIAKGHKGMAAKTRRARGFKFDALEMEEILAEERGEDIASNAIARKIRNLPIPDESRRGS